MNNKAFPYHAIELDRQRMLKVTFRSLMLFEEVRGINPLSPNFFNRMNATDLVVLLWACLRHEDKELTIETVSDMVNPKNYPSIKLELAKAWEAFKPKEVEGPVPLVQNLPG